MEIDASNPAKPQLWIYFLVSSVFLFPTALVAFFILYPYSLLDLYQTMIPIGIVMLVGLFILSGIIVVIKTRNPWFLSGFVSLLIAGSILSARLNDLYAMLRLLACVSIFMILLAGIGVTYYGMQLWQVYRKRDNQLPNWWWFLTVSVTFALTTFALLGYAIQGYDVVDRERLSDRTYYLVGNYNFLHVALFRCNSQGIYCRQIYFSGVKSPFSVYHIEVRDETLEFSTGSSIILTEQLNQDD